MRRINQEAKPAKMIEVGTRAVCKEELNYAKKAGIEFFTAQQIRNQGIKQIVKQLEEELADYENLYLSIDMDVLDPAYAPAVQNPEPEGLETHILLDILYNICDNRVIGFDVAEVAPNFDQGVSAIQAAKFLIMLANTLFVFSTSTLNQKILFLQQFCNKETIALVYMWVEPLTCF